MLSGEISAYLEEIGKASRECLAPWWREPPREAGRADRLRKEGNLPYESTNVAKLGALQQLATTIAANTQELPHLERSCLQYIEMVGTLQGLSKEQATLVASKQEASKKFKTLLIECQRLATVLRVAIKQHYGIRSEKLAEYNLQPFRGRKPKKQPEPVPAQPEQQTTEA